MFIIMHMTYVISMSFCAPSRAKSWRQTLKFHSPVSPDPLNARSLSSLGFPKSLPHKKFPRSANPPDLLTPVFLISMATNRPVDRSKEETDRRCLLRAVEYLSCCHVTWQRQRGARVYSDKKPARLTGLHAPLL